MRVFQTENMKSLIHQLNCINSPKHTMTAKVLSSVLQRRSICCSQEGTSVTPHVNQPSQDSGGRDGGSKKISLGNGGEDDDSKYSNLHFFLCLFLGILEVALLSGKNMDKIDLSYIPV